MTTRGVQDPMAARDDGGGTHPSRRASRGGAPASCPVRKLGRADRSGARPAAPAKPDKVSREAATCRASLAPASLFVNQVHVCNVYAILVSYIAHTIDGTLRASLGPRGACHITVAHHDSAVGKARC